MVNPKNPNYTFKKAWSWPHKIEEKVASLVERCKDDNHYHALHVCCGESAIGDIRLDLTKLADVKGDMFWLPFKPGIFDTVICDPPWGVPYHKRGRLLRQLRDCLKPGGRLIFNCFWFPKTRGLSVDSEIFAGVPHSLWRNASLLITARRMALQ